MSTPGLRAYKIFKLKPGEKEAEPVMKFTGSGKEQKLAEKKDILATKETTSSPGKQPYERHYPD